MNLLLIALAVAAAVLAALMLVVARQGSASRQKAEQIDYQVNELRRDMQAFVVAQAENAARVSTISQTVAQRLEGVTKTLQDGVANSAQIASQGQTAIANELKSAREQIGSIQKQLGEFQELSRGISAATKSLEGVLGGAKTRGFLGEVALERLLEDALSPSQYKMQYHFKSGEAVDAVVLLRDKKILCIDSKFPLEAFQRIATEGEPARGAFVHAVKGHTDSIAKKYILPQEDTLDLALMFVPSESVYYELLTSLDNKGLALDAYCRAKRVMPVSPNTLYAHLCVIAMGLRGMQIEDNARRLFANLSGLQKQLEIFCGVFEKLGTHLNHAQQSYSEADKRLDKTQNTLQTMLGTDSPRNLCESAQGSLALPVAEAER